ncbi:MAG: hypothetical protein ABIQ39_12345 [Ilumatobacteraceae bacterium]
MASTSPLKRLIDAGMQFNEMTQAAAERIVGEMVRAGELRRKDAEQTVHQLVQRGRAATEQMIAAVRSEVTKQIALVAGRLDDIESRIEDLAKRAGLTSKPSPPSKSPAKKAAVKKAPVKKAPVKKAAVKKAPAKKTATGTVSSGVGRVATRRTPAAKAAS